jgi:hypothetical protein
MTMYLDSNSACWQAAGTLQDEIAVDFGAVMTAMINAAAAATAAAAVASCADRRIHSLSFSLNLSAFAT